MAKLLLYLLSIVILAGLSAGLGQQWRYEGALQESIKERDGSIQFEKLKAEGDAEGQRIFADKESDGQIAASDIVQRATERGRTDAEKQVGELATARLYLEPRFGEARGVESLKRMLKAEAAISNLNHQETDRFENIVIAIQVLTEAGKRTRPLLDEVRIRQSDGAIERYEDRRSRLGCRN
jgi:hypothetical protein